MAANTGYWVFTPVKGQLHGVCGKGCQPFKSLLQLKDSFMKVDNPLIRCTNFKYSRQLFAIIPQII
jgi:hypothetical protein